jgi:hypothetical protein
MPAATAKASTQATAGRLENRYTSSRRGRRELRVLGKCAELPKIIIFCLISAMFGQKTGKIFYIFDLILDRLV